MKSKMVYWKSLIMLPVWSGLLIIQIYFDLTLPVTGWRYLMTGMMFGWWLANIIQLRRIIFSEETMREIVKRQAAAGDVKDHAT